MGEAMGRLQEFVKSLQEGELGQPLYLNSDINNLRKNMVRIEGRVNNLKEIQEVVDQHSAEVIAKLHDGAKNIQIEADRVWSTFAAFAQMGPVEIGRGMTEKEVNKKIAEKESEYKEYFEELHMQSVIFTNIGYHFSATQDILKLQMSLMDKDSIFGDRTNKFAIQQLLKEHKNVSKRINKLGSRINDITDLISKFGTGNTAEGLPALFGLDSRSVEFPSLEKRPKPTSLVEIKLRKSKGVDRMFFEIATAYLYYVYDVYELEEQARELDMRITEMQTVMSTPPKTPKEIKDIKQKATDRFNKDRQSTNAKLSKAYVRINALARSTPNYADVNINELKNIKRDSINTSNLLLASALQNAF